MDNQLVEGGNGSWSYSPLKYWPQSGALYFSAYAPYATADNGITPSYNTTTRTFDLSYALPADEDDQVDLLMAANVDVADCASRPSNVQFTFGHILSRVGLTARYSGSVTTGTTVTLTDVKISGKFVASGDYTVSGGWDNRAASASTIIYDRPAAKLAATTLTTSAQNLLSGDNYVMVIPNEDEVEVEGTITVYYTVTTPDGISMNYVKDASASLAYEPNKTYMYNLIIDLAADAIQFGDVTVSDWGTTVSGDVEVRNYVHRIEASHLSFTNINPTQTYSVTSVREYDNGVVEQVPWHAEFSTDGGSTYSTTVPDFFVVFTASDNESGTYTATVATETEDWEEVKITFVQDIDDSPLKLDAPKSTDTDVSFHKGLSLNILSNGTITWKTSATSFTCSISYKLNENDWVTIISSMSNPPSITVHTGDKILIKGNNFSGTGGSQVISGYSYFSGTAEFSASGNIMSLINGNDFPTLNTLPQNNYCAFRGLFSGSKIVSAKDLLLPIEELSYNTYERMFMDCTSLTEAPELPATKLGNECYYKMFKNCTSLTSCPALPATTLAYGCYSNMFDGCTNLTQAPSLPATTLANGCYSYMFLGCTSLTQAPSLPATILANSCYRGMFYNCTSLSSAPALPATTLANECYRDMFRNCTGIVISPELNAISLSDYCYCCMFYDCTSLTYTSSLPATTLAQSCYSNMFSGCTSLTTAPTLPATTLSNSCYYRMFSGCSSLSAVTCLATDISATDCTSYWLTGAASTGTFTKATSMTSWSRGYRGIPSGWTVQDAQ